MTADAGVPVVFATLTLVACAATPTEPPSGDRALAYVPPDKTSDGPFVKFPDPPPK